MPLTDVTTEQTLDLLRGRRIAIVGNSPVILEQHNGPKIDAADLVIRMNKATPCQFPEHHNAIGRRTDILACGNIQPFGKILKEIPPHFWWMKVTEHGAKKLEKFRLWMNSPVGKGWEQYRKPTCTLWQWPMDREMRMRENIGVPGTSGIRAISMCVDACAASVEVYGMTFWNLGAGRDEPSWYSGRPIHHSHNAKREYDYFRRAFPFTPQVEAGRWTWKP